MQKQFLVFLATLLPLVATHPLVARQDPAPFTVLALRSTTPIHLQFVTASQGSLWIGNDGPEAVFTGGDPRLNLDVAVAGGQQVYVASGGALGYTAPGTSAPAGATLTGFTWEAESGSLGGTLSVDGGFVACPETVGEPPYQIFAGVPAGRQGCIGFTAATPSYTGATPSQY